MNGLVTGLQGLRGRKVFVTGHTGFKGAWLCNWLVELGCEVSGYALAPANPPTLYALSDVGAKLRASHDADIRDLPTLQAALRASGAELVLHLAAQSLVRAGYADPAGTWETNVLGTVNVLEAVRACDQVRAVVVVTTDKCYDNQEWAWGYRENDRLGGRDPYSASKAGAEIVTHSYRESFLAEAGVLVASARAGNVIGGGDWSEDRLVADAARAFAAGSALQVRNPAATRPWQHVLDCLSGYLLLAARLLQGDTACARAFNFGPDAEAVVTVGQLLDQLSGHWPGLRWEHARVDAAAPHESTLLSLDPTLSRTVLKWQPRWNLDQTLRATADWYLGVSGDETRAAALTRQQISEYAQA